jgi:hypothetical protein
LSLPTPLDIDRSYSHSQDGGVLLEIVDHTAQKVGRNFSEFVQFF